ncbi:hypothetical protein N7507_006273 [Penicillium longicatenatum]|nr:hypothetical protein N7507_006273 [Penicillium longicatenatum]
MKHLGLHLVLLFGAFLGPVAAYGPRAAAEQMSYWYLYLLEGEYGRKSDTRTVAPLCAETMLGADGKDKACNLQQFLEYLWAPRMTEEKEEVNGQTVKKTVYTKGPKTKLLNQDGTPMSLEEAKKQRPYQAMKDVSKTAWQSAPLAKSYDLILQSVYTDGTDAERLVKGTGDDYWTARREVTRCLPEIAAHYPDIENPGKPYIRMQKYVAQCRAAIRSAFLVRLADFESYRIGNNLLQKMLQEKVGTKPNMVTRSVDSGVGFSFRTLDSDATVSANSAISGFAGELEETCAKYRTEDVNHWTAVQAAMGAITEGQCEVPTGIKLK